MGIDSMAMEVSEKKKTVVGTVNPVAVVKKLRKSWPTDIISVGPATEPKKKEEPNEPANYFYFVPTADENPNSCAIC
ncbi:heavy metal-associated isoprenylated plant protein 39-like [Typha latifolia]|uniref:heavy metal-associated isoprenylated plant protein 39-like n=1 Tax=Typha latifolia TaxID=4733 RepID=UPI003C2B1F07